MYSCVQFTISLTFYTSDTKLNLKDICTRSSVQINECCMLAMFSAHSAVSLLHIHLKCQFNISNAGIATYKPIEFSTAWVPTNYE